MTRLSRLSSISPSLALLLAGAAAAQAKKPAAPVAAPEPHFKAVCHFDNDTLAAETEKTAELAWAAAEKLMGPLPKGKPVPPAEIHLYADLKQFQDAQKQR